VFYFGFSCLNANWRRNKSRLESDPFRIFSRNLVICQCSVEDPHYMKPVNMTRYENLFQSCIDLVLASRDIDGVSSSIRAFRRPPPEPGLFSSRPVKSQQGSFISSQYSCISVLLLLNCKNLLLPVFDLSNLSRILSGSMEICFQIISFFNFLIFDVISSLELNSVQRLNFLEKAFKFSE